MLMKKYGSGRGVVVYPLNPSPSEVLHIQMKADENAVLLTLRIVWTTLEREQRPLIRGENAFELS
jgi:hypothetical protein